MKSTKTSLLYLLAILFLVSSCAGTEEEIDPSIPITFGIRSDKSLSEYEAVASNIAPYNTDSYPDFSSVVAFSYSLDGTDNADFIATGTLIDDEWILTAGHNFFSSDEQSEPADIAGIFILTGTDPNNPVLELEVERLVFHPSWLVQDDLFESANDLCLVKLKEPINSITPAKMASSTDINVGSLVWFAGYGDYSEVEGQNADLISKRHAIENTLDRIATGLQSRANGQVYTGTILATDFDDAGGLVNSLGDDFSATDENLLGQGTSSAMALPFEGTTVEGDSGGPIFVKVNNEWRVAGVLSGGADEPIRGHQDSSYGDISIFVSITDQVTWINSVISN